MNKSHAIQEGQKKQPPLGKALKEESSYVTGAWDTLGRLIGTLQRSR
jgi:hypothetical protein